MYEQSSQRLHGTLPARSFGFCSQSSELLVSEKANREGVELQGTKVLRYSSPSLFLKKQRNARVCLQLLISEL